MSFESDAEKKYRRVSPSSMHMILPHCEGAKRTSNSYAVDDDMINGENFFAFDWEHDSTFENDLGKRRYHNVCLWERIVRELRGVVS